jgi:hypothetical protein
MCNHLIIWQSSVGYTADNKTTIREDVRIKRINSRLFKAYVIFVGVVDFAKATPKHEAAS